MARKKKIIEEADALKLKLRDLEDELIALEEKRKSDLEEINKHLSGNYPDYFVGVILTLDDVLALIKLLQTNSTVKIPFNLYINEA